MFEAWTPSKRDLGAVYLVVVGLVFSVIVLVQAFSSGFRSLGQFLLLLLGFFLMAGLIRVGLWLTRSPLGEDRVLQVSQWGAFGIAMSMGVIAIGVIVISPLESSSGLFVTVIGAGGIIGTLAGTVRALNEEHEELQQLYGRNRVLQRVLRHNIRNGMTVVQGYAELLEENLNGTGADMVRSIRQEANTIVDLSEMARNLQSIDDDTTRKPMDISKIIEELIYGITQNYSRSHIETDIPTEVFAMGDNFVELALWEVLEYSVRNDAADPVVIDVTKRNGNVTVTVEDPGGPLPEDAMNALRRGSETQMEHLEGMELWVAKWLIENVDGDIEFERTESSTITTITLSATSRRPYEGGNSVADELVS